MNLDNPVRRALLGWGVWAVPLTIAIAMIATLSGATEQQVGLTFLTSLVAVVGFQIYSGNSGIMTFGHVAFMAIGAYAAGILAMPPAIKAQALPALPQFLRDIQLPLIPAIAGALVVVFLAALLFGVPFSRLSAAATPISTLAMLMIVYVILVGAEALTRGSQTFYGVPPLVNLWVALAAALLAILIARLFRDSIPGLRLRASREDELASRSMGVRVARHRLGAWLLSALVVGVAGALFGFTLTAFSPKQFYFTLQFEYVAMLVVGGASTVSGAIGGTVLVSLLMEAARRVEGVANGQVFGLQELVLGMLILAVMFGRKDGLFGFTEAEELISRAWRARRNAGNGTSATAGSVAGVSEEDPQPAAADGGETQRRPEDLSAGGPAPSG